uniref:C19orf22 homolog n=1 Tax=Caligus clemensi TaxID=344056 RepID=C1C1G8_CALCM|nr:C19orf22 homolog [Caligus clemensi]
MGVIKAKIEVKRPEVEGRSSSDEDSLEAIQDSLAAQAESHERGPPRGARTFRGIQAPSSKGTTLALKKGRRSRHRYENEKLLTTQHEDELIWDVVDRSSSSPRFSDLNEDLMTRFYYGDSVSNDEDECNQSSNRNGERAKANAENPEDFDPEVAYLSIGFNLRTALKKSLPVGMLSRLEEEIVDFFTENPHSFYIADELSSFERLLVHACSSYHCLRSYSFNESGKRKLRIGNPNPGSSSQTPVSPPT